MVSIIEKDFTFKDERGSIVQLIHDGYKQVNVITSKKGVFRGGHYHKLNKEAFFIVSGKLELIVEKEKHIFSEGQFFGIDIGDMHSFNFLEDTVLVSMYDIGVELENGLKDIYVE